MTTASPQLLSPYESPAGSMAASLDEGPAPQDSSARYDYASVNALHDRFQRAMASVTAGDPSNLLDVPRAITAWCNEQEQPHQINVIAAKFPLLDAFLKEIDRKAQPRLVASVLAFAATLVRDREESDEEMLMGSCFTLFGGGRNMSATECLSPVRVNDVEPDLPRLLRSMLEERKLPTMDEAVAIANRCCEVLCREKNLVQVSSPCVVVGDIHGQLTDLLENVLRLGGPLGQGTYVFLGDYVDRGDSSCMCVCLLAVAKLLYPERVVLLRGNHESRDINSVYGLTTECCNVYPLPANKSAQVQDHPVWTAFNRLFDTLPLAALIDDAVLCVHGGLSPDVVYLDSLFTLNRKHDIVSGSIAADLTWSDPTSSAGFQMSSRGTGAIFGPDATETFLKNNNLHWICRAHQCVRKGYQWDHNQKVLTVFSAPNYCGLGNQGALITLDKKLVPTFHVYSEAKKKDAAAEAEAQNRNAMALGLPIYFSSTANTTAAPPPTADAPPVAAAPTMQ